MPKSKTKRMRELAVASRKKEPGNFWYLSKQCSMIAQAIKKSQA